MSLRFFFVLVVVNGNFVPPHFFFKEACLFTIKCFTAHNTSTYNLLSQYTGGDINVRFSIKIGVASSHLLLWLHNTKHLCDNACHWNPDASRDKQRSTMCPSPEGTSVPAAPPSIHFLSVPAPHSGSPWGWNQRREAGLHLRQAVHLSLGGPWRANRHIHVYKTKRWNKLHRKFFWKKRWFVVGAIFRYTK